MKQNRGSWISGTSLILCQMRFFIENWHTNKQGHKKKNPILEVGGSTPAPPTQLGKFYFVHKGKMNPLFPLLYIEIS